MGPTRGAGADAAHGPLCARFLRHQWFTRRWVDKTGKRTDLHDLSSARHRSRYPRSAFTAVAQPWEIELAETLEERFAEIRRVARSVSRVRMAFRLHAKLERAAADALGQSPRESGNHREVAPGRTHETL